MNGHCKVTVHPFVTECNKRWWVLEKLGAKLAYFNPDNWSQDPFLTLECKDKGK